MSSTAEGAPSVRSENMPNDTDSASVSGSSYIGSDAPERDLTASPWRTEERNEDEASRDTALPSHADESPREQRVTDEEETANTIQPEDEATEAQPAQQSQPETQESLPVTEEASSSSPPEAHHVDRDEETLGSGSDRSGPAHLEPAASAESDSPQSEALFEVDTPVAEERAENVAEPVQHPEASTTLPEPQPRREPRVPSSLLIDVTPPSDAEGRSQTSTSRSGRASPRTPGTGRRGPIIVYGPYRSRYSSRGSPQPPPQRVRSMLLPDDEPPLPACPPTPPPLPRDTVQPQSSQPRIEISQSDNNHDDGNNQNNENNSETSRRPSAASIVLPRWQPDAEATYCPICRTQFGWLNRKHHCRKCGRVVCNSCSPHRITIPYQFIVQPPEAQRTQGLPSTLPLGSEGVYADFGGLGGGERVRLCNPCVPDPNTSPPQQSAQRARHSRAHSSNVEVGAGDPRRGPIRFATSPGPESRSRSTAATYQSLGLPGSSQGRTISATTPALGLPARQRSMFDIPQPTPSEVAPPSPSVSRQANRRSLPLAPPAPSPRRQPIPEEDECPVCHQELPSQNLPNCEELRENHISSCIISHSAYGASPAGTPLSPGMGPTGEGSSSPLSGTRPVRRTGMFPYVATEKDCVDSAECTICLEEFEVGVMMARLECLCRFHRRCITAWFVGHPGRCPVHQHDSFGF